MLPLISLFAEEYVVKKVKLWSEEIHVLSFFAQMHEAHSAYIAFTHGVVHKWNFLMRTVQSISHLFQPLEDVILDSCHVWQGSLVGVRETAPLLTMPSGRYEHTQSHKVF